MNNEKRERQPTQNGPPWEISEIGAKGDGIALTPDGPIYAPFAAPGDLVDGKTPPRIVFEGPNRSDPVCTHFGDCGGCALQHLPRNVLADEKRAWLRDALARKGFDTDVVGPLQAVPPGTRRRARLGYVRTAKGMLLGFNARREKRLVDLTECPVMTPELVALIPALRKLISQLRAFGKAGDVQMTASDTGVEIVFFPNRRSDPGYEDREAMVAFAATHDLARIGWGDGAGSEPVVAARPVRVVFGETLVEIPPAAFLQPSREGEALIGAAIKAALPPEPKRLAIADLYAGCGAIGLPLAAAGHKVLAVEGNAESVQSLRKATGALSLQAEMRDLARKPLAPSELERFDVAIFDPPRAGAARQSEALAASQVRRIIAVSCNPSTLARDLAILANGGYRLESATPIDQFPWAAHLEAVCVLVKP